MMMWKQGGILLVIIVLSCPGRGDCDAAQTAGAVAQPNGTPEDDWSPGVCLAYWERINSLQQYPLFTNEPPRRLAEDCRHPEPFVRAAACFAIGRASSEEYLSLLSPLLEDDVEFVRRSALWALLQIESPRIKQPLLDIIGAWPSLEPEGYGFRQGWLGLPDLQGEPLERRREWLRDFDADDWQPVFRATGRENDPLTTYGWSKAWLGARNTELDAGDPFAVRLRIIQIGGKMSESLRLASGTGRWRPFGRVGRPRSFDIRDHLLSFPRDLASVSGQATQLLQPDTTIGLDVVISGDRRPLPPGIYAFREWSGRHPWEARAPLLVRIRRNPESERAIPKLLDSLPQRDAVVALGAQKVRAAVPRLVELFRKNAGGNNFHVAAALAQIGDPAAIPVLMEYPRMQDSDMGGTTFEDLKAFGAVAYPAFEQRILDWRDGLAAGRLWQLETSLRLLGRHGSQSVDNARWDLIRRLVGELSSLPVEERWDEFGVLAAAVATMDRRRCGEFTELVWSVRRGDQDTFKQLVKTLYQPAVSREAVTVAIAAPLWRRYVSSPREDAPPRESLFKLLSKTDPDILLADRRTPASAAEAKLLLQLPGYKRIPQPILRRVESYVKSAPTAELQLLLGAAWFKHREYELAEKWLRETLAELEDEARQVQANYILGQVLIAQGSIDDGERQIRAASALMKPNRDYSMRGVFLNTRVIKERLAEAASFPRVDGWRWTRHIMPTPLDMSHRSLVADRCAFYFDDLRRLYRWDPLKEQGQLIQVIPRRVWRFLPVDRRNVFVVFMDGAAAMYQEGRAGPVWRTPWRIEYETYLTVSPQAVTAIDENRTLQTLAADTGSTLWTRGLDIAEREEDDYKGRSNWLRQAGEFMLIPDRPHYPTGFVCVGLADGETKWRRETDIRPVQIACGKDRCALAGKASGDCRLEVFSLAKGEPIWRTQVACGYESSVGPALAFSADNRRLFLVVRDQLWAIDAGSGEMLWRRRWRPADESEKLGQVYHPGLRAAHDVIHCLFRWTPPGKRGGFLRTEIVAWSTDGELLFHEPVPPKRGERDGMAGNSFVADQAFVYQTGVYWDVWRPAGH